MIDWTVIGTALGGVATGVLAYFKGRGTRKVENAKADAETDVVTLLRQEVERLAERVKGLEKREGRMIRHIYRLEGLMRGHGIEPPPFEIDEPIKAGLTDPD
jgi:hypothetical protein